MNDFRRVDKQMDDKLDGMIAGIATLNRHVKNINQANDVVAEKVRKNKKAVKELSQHIETENEKLKKILKKVLWSVIAVQTFQLLSLGNPVLMHSWAGRHHYQHDQKTLIHSLFCVYFCPTFAAITSRKMGDPPPKGSRCPIPSIVAWL